MESFSRIVRLHSVLRERRAPVAAGVLQERLACSRPTLFRTLAHLRDELGAPILNVPGRGYFYDRQRPCAMAFSSLQASPSAETASSAS